MKRVKMNDSEMVKFGDMPRAEHWRAKTEHDVPDDIAAKWVKRKMCVIVGQHVDAKPATQPKGDKPHGRAERRID